MSYFIIIMENNHKFVLIELEALESKLAITKTGD